MTYEHRQWIMHLRVQDEYSKGYDIMWSCLIQKQFLENNGAISVSLNCKENKKSKQPTIFSFQIFYKWMSSKLQK